MINDGDSQMSPLPIFPEGGGMSVHRLGTVKLFTFSFEIDAPNIVTCAPKIFSCAPKNLHLVAQVLPNSNLNFEPCTAVILVTLVILVVLVTLVILVTLVTLIILGRITRVTRLG